MFGFFGVAAAAYSAHGSADSRLTSAVALILLAHAPALVALASHLPRSKAIAIAIVLIIVGASLFSGDVMLKALGREGLFWRAAPTGGIALMAGWLAVVVAGFLHRG
nr:DUF423 domain-containing protein [Notoacmeibacter sp. MSK16QG-6]